MEQRFSRILLGIIVWRFVAAVSGVSYCVYSAWFGQVHTVCSAMLISFQALRLQATNVKYTDSTRTFSFQPNIYSNIHPRTPRDQMHIVLHCRTYCLPPVQWICASHIFKAHTAMQKKDPRAPTLTRCGTALNT